jgi:Ca-activated chloride channel family protein
MLAQDFKPCRLEAAKNTALEFIDGRPNDRIGLVVFAGRASHNAP